MADVTPITPILINQLAAQTTLSDSDYFIVGGSDAKKITVAQMKEALGINALNGKLFYINAISSDGSDFYKDFCSIDLSDQKGQRNRSYYFDKPESGEGWSNVPSDVSNSEWIGVRNVYYRTNFHVLVEIIEMHPIHGRIWTNFYNSGSWTGWSVLNQYNHYPENDGTGFYKNFLAFDPNNAQASQNKHYIFDKAANDDSWSEVPGEVNAYEWIGIRDVYVRHQNQAFVKIIEWYPNPGRLWFNFYNFGSWTGWRKIDTTN